MSSCLVDCATVQPAQILDLPRRKIKGVLLHQGEMMKSYAETGVSESDVALRLPTGSGKTLVGLMIGEWRRRKFHEKIVYLCPTKQLVNQVVEQAEESYGLTVRGFTGPVNQYNPAARAEYGNDDRIAVTTYSALFNTIRFSIIQRLSLSMTRTLPKTTSLRFGRCVLIGSSTRRCTQRSPDCYGR